MGLLTRILFAVFFVTANHVYAQPPSAPAELLKEGIKVVFPEIPGNREVRFSEVKITFDNTKHELVTPLWCEYTPKQMRDTLCISFFDKQGSTPYKFQRLGNNTLYIEGYIDPSTKVYHPATGIQFTPKEEMPKEWLPMVAKVGGKP